ncbi:MAG: toll/interleukin-1 receptor domain-containing protein [Synergistaceae bacterium]|jgi:hypothetical protein|nr:toll/interleukin-1 receptor domain-containing protein [Synergistaceae bacterium]
MTNTATPCAKNKTNIFVSYAHEDKDLVYSVIDGLTFSGYNAWYDKNISISSTWSDEIAKAILQSSVFVLFVTKSSMASPYVRSEVEFAHNKKMKIIPIFVEGVDILAPGLELMLLSTQGIEESNPQMITYKLCEWLKLQQDEESPKLPKLVEAGFIINTSTPTVIQPIYQSANTGSHDFTLDTAEAFAINEQAISSPFIRDEIRPTYPTSYINERKPEKQELEGGVSPISSPAVKLLIGLIFLVNVTKMVDAYVDAYFMTGFGVSSLISPFIRWGLSFAAICWFFSRRTNRRYSFFGVHPILRKLQTAFYWFFLLGYLIWTFDLNSFKNWAAWTARLCAWAQLSVGLDYDAIMAVNLPAAPSELQFAGFFLALVSGSLLFADMTGSYVRRFFLE